MRRTPIPHGLAPGSDTTCLPRLAAEYNPRVAEALVRLGELAAESQQAIEADVRQMTAAAIITRSPDCLVLKHGYLGSLPAFLRAEVLRMRLAARRLARGGHVGAAMATAGCAGAKQ